MTKEIIDYYDKESGGYTKKRYPEVTESYTQYVFKKRLEIALNFLESIKEEIPQNATLLEIGCADGVILKAIEERFPGMFSKLIGVDISPGMITEAKESNNNPRATYLLRDELLDQKFDVVMELGVHPFNLMGELEYVSGVLNPGGYFFYDLVGSKSIFVALKLQNAHFVSDYMPYSEAQKKLESFFTITKCVPYGLFVPKLWSVPILARYLQSPVDFVLRKLTPELFHEQIYLLKKNS